MELETSALVTRARLALSTSTCTTSLTLGSPQSSRTLAAIEMSRKIRFSFSASARSRGMSSPETLTCTGNPTGLPVSSVRVSMIAPGTRLSNSGCHFQDARLGRRFQKLVGQLESRLGQSIPLACQDWNNTKAAYRFL